MVQCYYSRKLKLNQLFLYCVAQSITPFRVRINLANLKIGSSLGNIQRSDVQHFCKHKIFSRQEQETHCSQFSGTLILNRSFHIRDPYAQPLPNKDGLVTRSGPTSIFRTVCPSIFRNQYKGMQSCSDMMRVK